MKRLFLAAAIMMLAATVLNAQDAHRRRLLHDEDGSDVLWNTTFQYRPLMVQDINAVVDMVAEGGTTTYMICSGSDYVYYPSRYTAAYYDKLRDSSIVCRDTANCRSRRGLGDNIRRLEAEGTDVIRATLTRARHDGMEAFITYRVNDLHYTDTTEVCPHWYTSDFWANHPELWVNQEGGGWHVAQSFDFAHPEVRQRKLDMISEQLDRYADVLDGYQLDFMRFFNYFRKGEGRQHAPEMTQLVRDIRRRVDEAGRRQGRKIMLVARVAPTLEINLEKGLDVRQWLREGLLDFISIGTHWQGEPRMPVRQFRESLGSDLKVPLYASIDEGGYQPYREWSEGMFRAQAAHAYEQGADGINSFNYWFWNEAASRYFNTPIPVKEGGLVRYGRTPALLQEMADPERLKARNKIYALSEDIDQYDIHMNTPLPLKLRQWQTGVANFRIADDIDRVKPRQVVLFFLTNHPANFNLSVNGVPLYTQQPRLARLYDRCRELKDTELDRMAAFIVPEGAMHQGDNEIKFNSVNNPDDIEVQRIEVALDFGDVDAHGYF